MGDNNSANSKRVAKNTLLLYIRMLLLMAIGLFTSRVILQTLGVEDFGIYNVVGGFVAIFGVLCSSLSAAASRFLTYEMGKGNNEKLKKVFSTTLIIHFLLAIAIAIICEAVGIWFVNNKMIIAPERIIAANWVFQFSILSFCLGVLIVPYNAAIIAHEKMSVFAYISIFDGVAKLLICYLLLISPIDRLVFYAFLHVLVSLIRSALFFFYCKRSFFECTIYLKFEKSLIKEIFGFASWNFIGASSAILRDQGGNIIINLFFGPVVNAARAVSNQVSSAVSGFVQNFMTALNPQITKSYASGESEYMMKLVFYGSRLSYYMLLLLSLPILISTDYLLDLWLDIVPDYSGLFVRLILVFSMIESISNPLITAQLATGDIRNYQLIVGGIQLMNLPISYVILKMGGPPETIMYVAIILSLCCLTTRLIMLRKMIDLDALDFFRRVILNVLSVTVISSIIPLIVSRYIKESFFSFIVISLLCVFCCALSILYFGLNKQERQLVYSKIKQIKEKKHK